MAHAIRSIYLKRIKILNARILIQKSIMLSWLSYSAIFFKMYMQNRKRINRQIDWGINVCLLRKKYDNTRDMQK